MSRGDDFPRYTYMMDFNPMDEDTPLRDYWQTTDDLDNEDAATIASLATQALQSKAGYEYGEAIEVSEPGVVANYMYSESRSSPQSQYSTTMPTEPAEPVEPEESFRGLMEDHDRDSRFPEEIAASGYDYEPETRGEVSSDVPGVEESAALSREHYTTESWRLLQSVAAEGEFATQNSYPREIEMSAAMLASRVVNGVLRRSYAGTPTEEAVNLQALQSQAPQPTPPRSESRSVSVERSNDSEPEKEPTMDADERHGDDEPENFLTTEEDEGIEGEDDEEREVEDDEGVEEGNDQGEEVEEDGGVQEENEEGRELEEGEGGDMGEDKGGESEEGEGGQKENDEQDDEEPTPDTGAQQQLMMESNERPAAHEDEDLPQTPRKRGRPRRSDTVVAPIDATSEQPETAETSIHEEATIVENEVEGVAATDGAHLSRVEETPKPRKRGRPHKSSTSEPATVTATAPTSAKRGRGRPPKAIDRKTAPEAAPTAARRGRPRKNSMANAARPSVIGLEQSTVEVSTTEPVRGRPGRPRRSDALAAAQTSTGSTQLPAARAAPARARSSSRRGRPRKTDALETERPSTNATHEATALIRARSSSRRGSPRRRDVQVAAASRAQSPSRKGRPLHSATARSRSRGRPRTSDVAMDLTETRGRSPSRRGRPRNSDVALHSATTRSRSRGRPRTSDVAMDSTETRGRSPSRRGRPRNSDVLDAATRARSSSRRGRPRKSDVAGAMQAFNEELEPLRGQRADSRAPSGRRGRPRKSDVAVEAEVPVTVTPVSSNREWPRENDVVGETQASLEELQQSLAEALMHTTLALSKRGWLKRNDVVGATAAQLLTREAQLLAAEPPTAATPVSGQRERPPKADSIVSAATPGRRGRPRETVALSMRTTTEVLPTDDTIWAVPSSVGRSPSRRGRPPRQSEAFEERDVSPSPQPTKKRGRGSVGRSSSRRGRSPRQSEAFEERDVSPSPLPHKKRGRGRPPRSEISLPPDLPEVTVEPSHDIDTQEAEPEEPLVPMADVSNDLAVGETSSTPVQEDAEATPSKKRGRRKAVLLDKPLPVMDVLVTASPEKRGRPPTVAAATDLAQEHEQPIEPEAQEEEEEPATKRRRTSSDTAMEDVAEEEETQEEAHGDELPDVQELTDAVGANSNSHKRSSVTWAKPLSSTFIESDPVAEPSPQRETRSRSSGETLEQSARPKRGERTLVAPPKTLFDMISSGRKLMRQKTYGKRSKR